MTVRLPRWLSIVLKGGISAGLMAFLLSHVDAGQVVSGLAGADPWWLAGSLLAAIAAWCINTWKWQRLLATVGQPQAYPYLLGLNFVGMFYSIVLPGQISGEVMKGIRLARRGAGTAPAALSIGLDRFTGLAALGAMGLAGLLLAPRVPASEVLLWLSGGVVVLVGVGLTVAPRLLAGEGTSPLRRAAGSYGPQVIAIAVLQSLVFQSLVTLSNYCVARSVGLEVALPALAWIVACVSLVHLLPISLAGLGIREAAYAGLLEQYGVPLPGGLAVSLAVFGVILAQALIGGLVELWWSFGAAGWKARRTLPYGRGSDRPLPPSS